MKESFEIEQHTSLMDFYKLMIVLSFQNKRFRRIYFLIAGVGVILALMQFLSPQPNWKQVLANLLLTTLFPLFFFLAGGFLLTVIIYLLKPGFFKATYLLNHWGMIRTTAKMKIELPWSKFIKWKETKDHILLFIIEYDAHIISKKNIAEQDIPDLRRLLGEKIGLF
jgi:hypothetical protein